MSEHTHQDPAQKWLIFFFCCFGSSVLAIGLWACFCYDVNKVDAPAAAAAHH